MITKFGRIFCLTRRRRQKCSPLQVNAPLTEKTWGRGWVVLFVAKKWRTLPSFQGQELTVAHNYHSKTKNLTAKTKYLMTKPKTWWQNQRPHGKTKYFTAKTKYLTAKANTHGKTRAILLSLWSIWFCRDVFVFAVSFLVLPWQCCGPPQELQLELGKIIAKNIAKTAKRQLGGRHLLFGEYLRRWTNLHVHYRRWT